MDQQIKWNLRSGASQRPKTDRYWTKILDQSESRNSLVWAVRWSGSSDVRSVKKAIMSNGIYEVRSGLIKPIWGPKQARVSSELFVIRNSQEICHVFRWTTKLLTVGFFPNQKQLSGYHQSWSNTAHIICLFLRSGILCGGWRDLQKNENRNICQTNFFRRNWS